MSLGGSSLVIATSNDAVVFGAVTLASDTTINTNASDTTGDITIAAVTGGSNTLTLTTENNVANTDITASGNISGVTTLTLADVGGTATFAGDVDVTTLTIGNTVANVAINGDGSTVTNDIDFANDGTLQLGDATGDTLTFNGGLDTSDVGGTVTLNGTIATSNDAVTFGAVTLGLSLIHI